MDDAERPIRSESAVADLIRRHPEVWHFADDAASQIDEAWLARTVDDIVSGARERRRAARRRRWRIVTAGAVVVMVATSGTVAALVARSGQPARPEAGVFCRAEASLLTHTVELGAGSDPIEGCLAEWESGSFAADVVGGVIPALVACIDPEGGAINVVPGDPGTCADLAMEPADAGLDSESLAVVALQNQLVEEINAAECAPANEVARQVQAILDESALSSWQVQMNADPATSVCAKVGVDSPTRVVFVFEL